MTRTIMLRPRGNPDPGARWADPTSRTVILEREDDRAWYGRPLDNPACPALEWPRFAWAEETPAVPEWVRRAQAGELPASDRTAER